MKLVSALLCTILPLLALSAEKKATNDAFSRFHSQAQSSTPIKLDDNSFSKLTALPRNLSAAVLLTAQDARFGCQLCRDFQPEWELLAKSWMKGDRNGESRMVFGTLDFMDGKQTFQSVRAPLAIF